MQSATKRLKLTVNDKVYRVEVGNLDASPVAVKVNGQSYLVTIAPDDAEISAADIQTASSRTAATKATAAPGASTVGTVKAPMPGNILDIQVKPGDRVSVKQTLCSLEAMKMKNAIRSPRDGVIATVAVAEGQTVAHGDVLFTFE